MYENASRSTKHHRGRRFLRGTSPSTNMDIGYRIFARSLGLLTVGGLFTGPLGQVQNRCAFSRAQGTQQAGHAARGHVSLPACLPFIRNALVAHGAAERSTIRTNLRSIILLAITIRESAEGRLADKIIQCRCRCF